MKTLILVVFLHSLGLCIAECPSVNWVQYNNTCYLFSNHGRNWLDAEKDCKKYDQHGSLATIDTPQKMSFVSQIMTVLTYLGHGDHWIGGNDYVIEGEFRWIRSGLGTQYTNWAVNRPNNTDTNEDCIAIQNFNGTYKWVDQECFRHNYWYICEAPVVSTINGPVIG